jgi:TrpR-related protein YerC/YecD
MNFEEKELKVSAVEELFEVFLTLETRDEMERFMRDLCTPQEISVLAERWRVCRLLAQGDLSYREISQKTGASLATITRIARFLRTEAHQGYAAVLKKMKLIPEKSKKR